MTAGSNPAASSGVDARKREVPPALPKSWEPGAVESELYRGWVDAGYFEADASSEKPAYSIVLPPPNVTGSLHMGHALDRDDLSDLRGVLTPATALGDALLARLPGAGVTMKTERL